MSEHLTREQLAELTEAVKNRETFTASGMHINYGQSEDYYKGYNDGFDHFTAGKVIMDKSNARNEDPWKSSYCRGYDEGWTDGSEDESAADQRAGRGGAEG